MAKKRKKEQEEPISCIMYLSTEGDLWHARERERKQYRYIMEYTNAHNIRIVKMMNRDVKGQEGVNSDFAKMVDMVRRGIADGILVAAMMCISNDLPDAYKKVGMVKEAGGVMVSVDDPDLEMNIREVNVYDR